MRNLVIPVPIPNTKVKQITADGTAGEALWESRWSPGHMKTSFNMESSFFIHYYFTRIKIFYKINVEK